MSWGLVSGIISAGAAVAGTVASFKSADAAEESAKARSQAVAIQRRQEELSNARKRRQIIRERRISAANNLARGVATGMQGSSSLAGIQGALNTNFASNLSFLDQVAALSTEKSSFLDLAQRSAAQADIFSAASSLAFTGSSVAGNAFMRTPEFDQLSKTIFGGK